MRPVLIVEVEGKDSCKRYTCYTCGQRRKGNHRIAVGPKGGTYKICERCADVLRLKYSVKVVKVQSEEDIERMISKVCFTNGVHKRKCNVSVVHAHNKNTLDDMTGRRVGVKAQNRICRCR